MNIQAPPELSRRNPTVYRPSVDVTFPPHFQRTLTYYPDMPCDCELDLARRWVRCRAWGIVTYDEAIAARHKFTSNPNFSPSFSQIYDAREVTRIAISGAEIGLLARDAIFESGAPRALVAPNRETYSFGRSFLLYHQINANKQQIRLFRTIEEAEAWLTA